MIGFFKDILLLATRKVWIIEDFMNIVNLYSPKM
jgi:hypothetical protein